MRIVPLGTLMRSFACRAPVDSTICDNWSRAYMQWTGNNAVLHRSLGEAGQKRQAGERPRAGAHNPPTPRQTLDRPK